MSSRATTSSSSRAPVASRNREKRGKSRVPFRYRWPRVVQVPKDTRTYELEDFDWDKAKKVRDLKFTRTNGAVMDPWNMTPYDFVQHSEEVPHMPRVTKNVYAPKKFLFLNNQELHWDYRNGATWTGPDTSPACDTAGHDGVGGSAVPVAVSGGPQGHRAL